MRNNPYRACRRRSTYHTEGSDDIRGYAFAITLESDVRQMKSGNIVVIRVNHKVLLEFRGRAYLCMILGTFGELALFLHEDDSLLLTPFLLSLKADRDGEQSESYRIYDYIVQLLTFCFIVYVNGFHCNVTGVMSTVPIATSCVPRRCGADSDTKKPSASSWNCTYGAKQPFYRLQKVEDNVRLSYLSSSPPLSVPHALDQAPLIVFTSRCSKASTCRHTPSTCSFSRTARRRTSSRSRRCPCLTRRACRWGLRCGKDAAATVAVVTPTGASGLTTKSTPVPSVSSSSSLSSVPAQGATHWL